MNRIRVGSYVIGMVQTNCYYMHLADSADTIVFDPADYGDRLWKALDGEGLCIRAVFLTHGHFDHIWGLADLLETCRRERPDVPVKVYASLSEKNLLGDPDLNSSADYGRPCTVCPDVWLTDGEIVTECGIALHVINTPGHTEGSCCYYLDQDGTRILISGDTLFENSVGRTDLPTGSMGNLVRSIRDKLFVLPDDTVVYPGHGGPTTIGDEKRYNPFVQ